MRFRHMVRKFPTADWGSTPIAVVTSSAGLKDDGPCPFSSSPCHDALVAPRAAAFRPIRGPERTSESVVWSGGLDAVNFPSQYPGLDLSIFSLALGYNRLPKT